MSLERDDCIMEPHFIMTTSELGLDNKSHHFSSNSKTADFILSSLLEIPFYVFRTGMYIN